MSTRIGPFTFGPNTLWLGLHGVLMFLILVFAAFLFGAIYFTRQPGAQTVRRLKISAAVTFAARLLLMISGIIPGIGFGDHRLDPARPSRLRGRDHPGPPAHPALT